MKKAIPMLVTALVGGLLFSTSAPAEPRMGRKAVLAAPGAVMTPKRAPARRTAPVQAQQVEVAAPGQSGGPAVPGPVYGVPSLPNLIVQPYAATSSPEGFPSTGYCGSNGSDGGPADTIRAKVKNVGDSIALASTVRFQFSMSNGPDQVVDVNIWPVGPQATRNVTVPIPEGCYPGHVGAHGTCDVLIHADAFEVLPETDNNDNYDDGHCMLPAS